MKWLRWWRTDNDEAQARAEQERRLRIAQRQTATMQHRARELRELPAEEFAERVAAAFRLRSQSS